MENSLNEAYPNQQILIAKLITYVFFALIEVRNEWSVHPNGGTWTRFHFLKQM